MEVGEEAASRQPEELVPRQVEFPQRRQNQDKVSEVVVAQVQNLHTERTEEVALRGGR